MLPAMRPAALARVSAPPRLLFARATLPSRTSFAVARFLNTDSTLVSPSTIDESEALPASSSDATASAQTTSQVFPLRTQYPYHVGRTTSNNLPVYEKKSRSNPATVTWTEIRRIDGDHTGLKALKADLENYLGLAGSTLSPGEGTVAGETEAKPRRRRPIKRKQKDDGIKINPTTSHLIIPVSSWEALLGMARELAYPREISDPLTD